MSAPAPATSAPPGAMAQTALLLGRVSHPRRAVLTASLLVLGVTWTLVVTGAIVVTASGDGLRA